MRAIAPAVKPPVYSGLAAGQSPLKGAEQRQGPAAGTLCKAFYLSTN